jgi:hypothetical protein
LAATATAMNNAKYFPLPQNEPTNIQDPESDLSSMGTAPSFKRHRKPKGHHTLSNKKEMDAMEVPSKKKLFSNLFKSLDYRTPDNIPLRRWYQQANLKKVSLSHQSM